MEFDVPETDVPVTTLLREWRSGQEEALEPLMALVYDELRRIAAGQLRGERPDHTLQPTELVHESFLRLMGAKVDWRDRAHFLAIAATVMRRVLVDHARARGRQRRGGGIRPEPLDGIQVSGDLPSTDLVALDHAMEALAEIDARKSRIVELHYFGGLTLSEVGQVLGVSTATAQRGLALAKAWLYRELAST